ncbi:DUF7322 domain-containing protein [Natronocalculus amylovorans]|uniref:DUF7322 domain-containing protein n=1 Tax=Natronocalculus amylovorans TaxID=2917812 RepID=A0AAE3FUF5_9EURY|nr:hypothetical protein [Natronocalculus amylovorans]MCL9815416.1 hypothetical protein [Natronocalculus amylovorans]NUE02068.1 hypothetical protein [Halorubraceae archaeon YAN]
MSDRSSDETASDRVARYVDEHASDDGFSDMPGVGFPGGSSLEKEIQVDTEKLEKNLSNADPNTSRRFITAVILANVGLLAVSLSLMLIVFRSSFDVGGVLLLVGLLALGRTYQQVKSHRRYVEKKNESEPETDAEEQSNTPAEHNG